VTSTDCKNEVKSSKKGIEIIDGKEQRVYKYKASSNKRIINQCPHSDAVYYAKGMCRNCYHQKGRAKKATKCDHNNRPLYAKGVCKACYLNFHYCRKDVKLR
jgi:hypothetical protein